MSTMQQQMNTDFQTHRIEGFIPGRGIEGVISVPLISKIEDRLYQGGCLPGVTLPPHIDFVLSLYPWGQYSLRSHQARQEVEMYDHGSMPDIDQLHQLADTVNIRRKESVVLVHCQAGLNRSGLVTALALIKSGMTPRDAIHLLRSSRSPMVLCNNTFEEWLLNQ